MPVRGASPYDVVVGWDVVDRLPAVLGGEVLRVAVLHPTAIAELVRPVFDLLRESYDVTPIPLPDAEEAKTAKVLADCWEALGAAGFTRSDAIITVGGGATTDLGGFVAASWLRGVRVVHLPTTLLAMVDAAVGGKTGINTAAGKNLVGAFHEPAGVLCDLSLLAGLPRPELVAGLGEVVKCGFIADPAILDLVESTEPAALVAESPELRELIERSIRVKIDVVVADLCEVGGIDGNPGREVLNYGHTLAHAIERVEGYRLRHGEAVAVGCCFAAELGVRAGSLAVEVVDRHRSAFGRVGLSTTYTGDGSYDELRTAMSLDKKSRGATLRFVVLDDVARPRILTAPGESALRASYDAISNGQR
jgi:3-dehydroquinate synthase